MTVLDAGWPCYALWGLLWEWRVPPEPGLHSPSLSHSFQLRGRFVSGKWRAPRLIPLRPIWPGFAINTLFYAVVLWLLICGPFALRRLVERNGGASGEHGARARSMG